MSSEISQPVQLVTLTIPHRYLNSFALVLGVRESIDWIGTPRPDSQHKGDPSILEKQGAGNKTQEVEDKGEAAGSKGEEEGTFVPDKGLPLDSEETGMTHRKMEVYKGKGGNPMLG